MDDSNDPLVALADLLSHDQVENRINAVNDLLQNFLRPFNTIPRSDDDDKLTFVMFLLKQRLSDNGALIQCKICNTLSKLIKDEEDPVNSSLADGLTNVKIFQTLYGMLMCQCNSKSVTNKKLSACFGLIIDILNSSSAKWNEFAAIFDRKALLKVLSTEHELSTNAAITMLNLMTILNDETVALHQRVITYDALVPVLVDFIPTFDDDAKQVICDTLQAMVDNMQQNLNVCVRVGLITNILHLLYATELPISVRNSLINIVEIIGCLSITGQQLKLFIRLFQKTNTDNQGICHRNRLVESLECMASVNVRYQPQCYIDFFNIHSDTFVRCPSIQDWKGSGLTIHTWLRLDFTLPNNVQLSKDSKVRHMLYSYVNNKGCGFEGFFTQEKFLVVASFTKKEYLTAVFESFRFDDMKWHGLTVVHSNKSNGKNMVTVYVDETEIELKSLLFPAINKEFVLGCIGASFKTMSECQPRSPVYDNQVNIWGTPGNLKGQMATFTLFNESLVKEDIYELAEAGPNSHLYFNEKETMIDACALSFYFSSAVFSYNAKVAKDGELIDMCQSFKYKRLQKKNLNAAIGRLYKIQESVQSIGGLPTLFPLIQRAYFQNEEEALLVVEEDELKNEPKDFTAEDFLTGNLCASFQKWIGGDADDVDQVRDTVNHVQRTVLSDWNLFHLKRPPIQRHSSTNSNETLRLILLTHCMIGGRKNDPALDIQSIHTIGYLLQNCDSRLITLDFLQSVSQLIEGLVGVQPVLLETVYQCILFDFKIWFKATFVVQMSHIQFIHTIVKDDPRYFDSLFGIGFFIRIVEIFYSGDENELCLLDQSEKQVLRKALLGLMKYLFKMDPTKQSMLQIIGCMSYVSHTRCLDDVLDLINGLVRQPNVFSQSLCDYFVENATLTLYRWMVHDVVSSETQSTIASIFINILNLYKLTEDLKEQVTLKNIFPALGEFFNKENISQNVLIKLLYLGKCKQMTQVLNADIYSNFEVVLTVLKLCESVRLEFKLKVIIEINRCLKVLPSYAVHCAEIDGWYVPFWNLLVSEGETDLCMVMLEPELVTMVIEIIHLVMWNGIVGSSDDVWVKRLEALNYLHEMPCKFLQQVLVMERKILERCLYTAHKDLNDSSSPYYVNFQNALQVLKVVQDFLISEELLESSSLKWSSLLIDSIFNLLDVMGAGSAENEGELMAELHLITERLLYLAFAQCGSHKGMLETCKYRLNQLLFKRNVVDYGEVCFEVYNLYEVLKVLVEHEIDTELILAPLLQRFQKFKEHLILANRLAYMPALITSSFKKNFIAYMMTDEYQAFCAAIHENAKNFENKTFSKSLTDASNLRTNSLLSMREATGRRKAFVASASEYFISTVKGSFDAHCFEEQLRVKAHKTMFQDRNAAIEKICKYQKRFLKSECGAWKSSDVTTRRFKLSRIENRFRMRLKLTENFKFNPHSDASERFNEENVDKPATLYLNVPLCGNTEEENEEEENDEIEADQSLLDFARLGPTHSEASDSILYTFDCQLIILMDIIAGRMELTKTCLYFYEVEQRTDDNITYDFRVSLNDLREIYFRRHNLRKTAMEFFLLDRSTFFINFSTVAERLGFYRKLVSFRPTNLFFNGIRKPAKMLEESGLTKKWVNRQISNFEYLMQLNTISGRTFNDLAQYPVFPWILNDYKSETIDLNDPSIYRDLSKPMGSLSSSRAKEAKIRFESIIDDDFNQKAHYFTHYSNPAYVLHYMLRVEPFTSLHIQLQSGRFDCPNRQFYSISGTWDMILNDGGTKELIPEFFFFPEFLINLNGFNFGCLKNGTIVDDVILPRWANDPYNFVDIHRKALESEYVSNNLHSWLDLIFGYKQKGREAELALNVFNKYTMEGAVDLDLISDPVMRKSIECMINNFGQTPTQLLKKPHPKRMKLTEKSGSDLSVFNNLSEATYSLIEIFHKSPVVYIATCKPRKRITVVPDPLVIVHLNALFGIHSWLAKGDADKPQLSFTRDVKLSSSARSLSGCLSPSVSLSSRLFGFTSDGKLMMSCGYWDNSIHVVNTDKGNDTLKMRIYYHNDIVTCLSVDSDGAHLITGSADLTCAVWKIEKTRGVSIGLSERPVQVLYGHNACITDVAMLADLDIVVSGAKDGICLIHTLHKGIYMHTLLPSNPQFPYLATSVVQVQLSDQGRVVVQFNQPAAENKSHFICVYSINGVLLSNLCMDHVVLAMLIVNAYIITGGENGALQIRSIDSVQKIVYNKNVRSAIYTIASTYNGSHIFIGREDGNILVLCPTLA